MKTILIILLSYLLGSVSISIILSRAVFHSDIRSCGSGNAGATNAARVFGWKVGFITFAGDFAKGLAAMYLGQALDGERGLALAGMACLMGHCFPVHYRFKGGKAVSVGAAVALMIDLRVFAIVMILFAIIAVTTRWVSLASISAALALIVITPFFSHSPWLIGLSVFGAVLLIFMHRSNIRRLLTGKEPKFTPGHPPKKT